MQKISKRTKLLVCLILILFLVIVLATSYGYLYYGASQEKANTIKTACYNLSYSQESDSINMQYAYPLSDEDGIKQTAYTMTLTNNCDSSISYQVDLNIMDTSTTSDNSIRLDYNDVISNLTDYDVVSSSISDTKYAYRISSAVLESNQSTTISLRAWMSSTVENGQEENTQFVNKVTIDINNANKDESISLNNVLMNNYVVNSSSNKSKIGLYSADENGTQSYYLYGEVQNNYVSFANLLWRVVRINSDNTIRLILDNSAGTTMYNSFVDTQSSGYTYNNQSICSYNNPCNTKTTTSSNIKTYLEDWYDSNLSAYDSYIAKSSFCNDSSTNASSRVSSLSLSLTCPSTSLNYGGYYKLKIGLLSVDEMLLSSSTYARGMSMTPSDSSHIYVLQNKEVFTGLVTDNNEVYPVINLKASVLVLNGDGTKNNPYVIQT